MRGGERVWCVVGEVLIVGGFVGEKERRGETWRGKHGEEEG